MQVLGTVLLQLPEQQLPFPLQDSPRPTLFALLPQTPFWQELPLPVHWQVEVHAAQFATDGAAEHTPLQQIVDEH